MSLFASPRSAATLQPIGLPGADLRFAPQWLDVAEADALFDTLLTGVPWETHRIRIFGREVDSPRRSCWIGDAAAVYTYSRTLFVPKPWTPALTALRAKIEAACGATFDSVLANLYRDGRDSMGWHSDDEPELGAAPVIASVSLGAVRRFVLKHRREPGPTTSLELPHGSLLVMAGATQRNYRHALPRTARVSQPRINLTFRRVGT